MNFIKLFFLFFMVPQFVFSEEKDLVKVLVSDKNFYSNINKKDDSPNLTFNEDLKLAKNKNKFEISNLYFFLFFLILVLFFLKKFFLKNKSLFFEKINFFSSIKKNLSENNLKIISVNYLDSKKKIVIAKIFDKILVLGVSNDSINLITEFDSEPHLDKEGETSSEKFDTLLKSEIKKPDVRSRIKSRLEGMRQL
jgi:flagellar biogenesis protein FliO